MSLSSEQQQWLYFLTKNTAWLAQAQGDSSADPEQAEQNKQELAKLKDDLNAFEIAKDNAAQKQKVLAYVRNTLLSLQQEIKQAFDTEVTFIKEKVIQGQDKAKIAMFNDDNMAFDFMEDINDLPKEFFEGELKKKWDQAGVRIAMLELEMRENNLFTEDEIAKELFTPLVQQQILPETFVPNAYSAVQKMIDDTNKLYIKELADADEESRIAVDILKDSIAVSSAIVKASLGFAEGAENITKEQAKLGEAITDIVATTAVTTIDTVEMLYDSGDISGACQLILKDLSNAVSKTIITAMGKGSDDGKSAKQIATFVALSMQSAATGIKIAKAKDPREAFAAALEDILVTGCKFGINATDKDTKNILELIQKGIEKTFAAKSYIEQLKSKIREMDPQNLNFSQILSLVIQTGLDGLEQALDLKNIVETQQKLAAKKAAEAELEKLGKDGDLARIEKLTALVEKLDKDLEDDDDDPGDGIIPEDGVSLDSVMEILGEGGFEADDFLSIDIPETEIKSLASNIKKSDQQTAENLKEEMNRILEEEKEELQEQIALLQSIDETAPSDKDLQTIEKLLAQLQKDRAIWDKVFSIAEKGTAAAKAALTVLGPGVVMVQLIKSISEAVIRAREVLTWKDNLEDAQTVSNPYLTSVQGMLSQQTEHLTQDGIKTALLIVKLAGEIASLTPASAVGKLVSAGADLAMEVEEFLYKTYKRAQLKKAWEQTKIALEHPEYRRQNLYIRKLNPTLAKYTLAFGAVVAKDPIAVSTMNRIGITTEMLEHPSAGVDKVKNYLEVHYNKDMEVKYKYVEKDDWVRSLPPVKLEETHWLIATTKAREVHAGCQLDDDAIRTALQRLAETRKQFLKKQEIDEVQAYCQAFTDLEAAVTAFSPVDRNGGDLQTMNNVKEDYLGLIEAETENISAVRNAIQKRLSQLAEK